MSVEILARIQFAFTTVFYYIYPPLSIGLGVVLVIMEGMFLKTRNPMYERLTRFWIRISALIFGIGVATGIVMEFEFGTNWATYARYVGDIFGSALAAAGIFAFVLESGFLGILLFGWHRVSPRLHFFATVMVALGSMFSAVWIVVANSWQQTPAGFHLVGSGLTARAEVTDFWAMVFNPSSMDRLSHAVIGGFLSGSFLVLSVSAWYLLKGRFVVSSKAAFKIALAVATVSGLGQLITGHHSANGMAVNQPAKLAAFEGHYATLAARPAGAPARPAPRILLRVSVFSLLFGALGLAWYHRSRRPQHWHPRVGLLSPVRVLPSGELSQPVTRYIWPYHARRATHPRLS
ncbi:cytochrome ubiquinol oxidase subunit I [Hymenobacter psoromatis]|uniref:cytochrome ubiquinol oxidase subunit I n=1 Tax=Hymenobacter psoromatis TaxID=1484116 RepID=UPI002FCDD03F